MVTRSDADAVIGAICTGRFMLTSSGPMTLPPASSLTSLAAMLAECSPGMISTLAGPDRRRERIEAAHRRVERHIGRHFAFIFEADAAFIEQLHRAAQIADDFARRIAEIGIADEGDARFLAEPARDGGGLFGDIGQLFGIGAFGDGGIGDEDRFRFADDHVDAERAMALATDR